MDYTYQKEEAVFDLPTPANRSYRTPPRSRPRSRQWDRHGSTSPVSSSPAPHPPDADLSLEMRQGSKDSANDESISPLDPRRLTPTLHASLVSEILSLRRDVESKVKDIQNLEASLHTTRNENESLQETIASTSKGTRSLRRQMQLLEGGSVSALSELSKERDEALDDAADLRKRLQLCQKKTRSHEERAEQIQMLWEHDRGSWETEKRMLEAKVHVVEGRLKVVLSEIANSQMANGEILHQNVSHSHYQSPRKIHIRKGSTASMRSIGPTGRRRDSEVSSGAQDGNLHEHRLSTITLANGHSTSLADELAIDEEEEDPEYHSVAHEYQASRDELPRERPRSVQLHLMDLKARKVLGLAAEDQLLPLAVTEQQGQQADTSMCTDATSNIQASEETRYVDAAIQYSPPASPELSPAADSPKATDDNEKTVLFSDALSHQDSGTAVAPTYTSESPVKTFGAGSIMISTSCQTSAQLPSPPWTPLTPLNLSTEVFPASYASAPHMISIATQTDPDHDNEEPNARTEISAISFQGLSIPSIAIHPPGSRPATPTSDVVLPPHTKNASCQVNIQDLLRYSSISTQTEENHLDAQSAQLRERLPSFIKTLQPTDNEIIRKPSLLQPANPLPNSSRRRLQQPSPFVLASSQKRLPGSIVDTPVLSPTVGLEGFKAQTQAETPSVHSEPPASYAAANSHIRNGIDEVEQKQFDEDDIFSRPMAKFTLKAGKLVEKDDPEVDYQEVSDRSIATANEPGPGLGDEATTERSDSRMRQDQQSNVSSVRPLDRRLKTLGSTSKPLDIRKAALVSSGAAAHQSSAVRDPGGPVNPPPFPVPTRYSSRKLPLSASEGAQSPTPAGRSPRMRDGKTRKPVVRKARSATNLARLSTPGRQQSPSPPIPSSQYHVAKRPGQILPPMPFRDTAPAQGLDSVTSRRQGVNQQHSHLRTDSASTMLQQTSVVDAIAQTMVGEWMYKYVRRRKSFGVPEPKSQDWDLMRSGEEPSAKATSPGVRHKRWVWLAPYERAVMWSGKQPTSGSALMGKSGRKLEIQSVLDVRDDNPLPRGSGPGPHLNRSILILTPERALKFTATSQERHYVWLAALSFLSHSPVGIGELTSLPSVPQQEYSAPPPSGGSLRRNPIRDSIHVAKGRETAGRRAAQRSFTTDGVIPQHRAETEDLYQPGDAIREPSSDAADPPIVPRYPANSRRRSNTAPRAPPAPSFRNFSNQSTTQSPPSTYSMTTATASDVCTPPIYHGLNGWQTVKSSFSRRGSEAGASVATAGYFDLGTPTMRMEAFITGSQRSRGSKRPRKGRKKDMGYWGVDEEVVQPGGELPDEVVNHSRSPTMQGGYPGLPMGERPFMNDENHRAKEHVIQEGWEFDGTTGFAGHFRGF